MSSGTWAQLLTNPNNAGGTDGVGLGDASSRAFQPASIRDRGLGSVRQGTFS